MAYFTVHLRCSSYRKIIEEKKSVEEKYKRTTGNMGKFFRLPFKAEPGILPRYLYEYVEGRLSLALL